jgi:hypothetical protein
MAEELVHPKALAPLAGAGEAGGMDWIYEASCMRISMWSVKMQIYLHIEK